MGSLSTEPRGHAGSADELMAVARALEEEACRQYRRLADLMRRGGEDALAAVFDSLSWIEQKHADEVDRRALAATGRKPDPTRVRWELPEGFDAAEAGSYLLTPYRVLAIAVRNEERAFAFYTYLAAYAEDALVRELAESSAKDELEHAALLRRERRKAWRSERQAGSIPGRRSPRPRTLADCLADVAATERAASQAHRALAERLIAAGRADIARLFQRAATEEENAAADAQARLGGGTVRAKPVPSLMTTREGLQLLEESFEQYSIVAEHATDPAVTDACQEFSEQALRRLSYVQGSIGNALITDPATIRRLVDDEAAILAGESSDSLRRDLGP